MSKHLSICLSLFTLENENAGVSNPLSLMSLSTARLPGMCSSGPSKVTYETPNLVAVMSSMGTSQIKSVLKCKLFLNFDPLLLNKKSESAKAKSTSSSPSSVCSQRETLRFSKRNFLNSTHQLSTPAEEKKQCTIYIKPNILRGEIQEFPRLSSEKRSPLRLHCRLQGVSSQT